MSDQNTNIRTYWLEQMLKIASPVLTSLSESKLRENMPVESVEGLEEDRAQYTYLEALGRTLAGLAPWLEQVKSDPAEEELRIRYADLARGSIDRATDPASKDFMNFGEGFQPVVDAAFLAHAIVRAPDQLFRKLDDKSKANLVNCLKITRSIRPYPNNWLLFSAMIETSLYIMEGECDLMRIDYALRQHIQWYKGDGAFGDGRHFHWDYYNSFVIQPMLVDILAVVGDQFDDWKSYIDPVKTVSSRYAGVQERMISPEGTYPPIGRSLAYRFGAFQHLAQMALQKNLPEEISPSQVRSALTAVIKKTMEMPGNFDENGWLRIGICGSQPGLGESYISTGSLYLCSTVFLPLGLEEDDEFWSDTDRPWTAKKVWSGEDVEYDKALRMDL